jgi:hypothetical protein
MWDTSRHTALKHLLCFSALIFLTHTIAFSQTAGQEPPLTNADVIKLASLGLGDDVVIAKINQALTVNFILDTGSIEKMKKAKLSNNVIGAMLKRSSAPAQGQPANLESANTAPTTANSASPGSNEIMPSGDVFSESPPARMVLVTKDGRRVLKSIALLINFTGFMGIGVQHIDFATAKAAVRTTDVRPSFLLHSGQQPNGGILIAKVTSNEKTTNRSIAVKGGNKLFKTGDVSLESKKLVDFEITEESNEIYRLTINKDLDKGEYAIVPKQNRSFYPIFDFGVD